ncbi:MAG TPA: hypothetical protein VI279_02485 [Rhodocyclaceae bacterium]
MTGILRTYLAAWLLAAALPCLAVEELGFAPLGAEQRVPYILDSVSATPRYVLILFPGGNGIVDPHMEGRRLVYQMRGNFLLRVREFWVDQEFATVTTNSTQQEERVQALLDALARRFPGAAIYLLGTSRGTFDTMRLAGYLSSRIAGVIHTSSLSGIASFDGRQYANRQLLVHHRDDNCKATPFSAAQHAHDSYGTELIAMEGGISEGDLCGAFAHHGYNGIEQQTVEAIKAWIKRGG